MFKTVFERSKQYSRDGVLNGNPPKTLTLGTLWSYRSLIPTLAATHTLPVGHSWGLLFKDSRVYLLITYCVIFGKENSSSGTLKGNETVACISRKVPEQIGERVSCSEWCLEPSFYGTLNITLMWVTGGEGSGKMTRQKIVGPGDVSFRKTSVHVWRHWLMISPVPGERQSRSTGVLRDGNPRGGILKLHPSGDGRSTGLNSPQCPRVTPRCLPKGSKSLFQAEAGNHETSLIQRYAHCLTAVVYWKSRT